MDPNDIDVMSDDGQAVYYKKEEVIANGEVARQFVVDSGGSLLEPQRDEETPRISSFAEASLLSVTGHPLDVVAEARAQGLRVQLNHVLFAHGDCHCDPCCGADPYGAFPLKATPLKATAFQATPLKATAAGTSAEATEATDFSNQPQAASANVDVWILDTGAARSDVPTPLHDRIDGDFSDHPDRVPQTGDGKVDPVAGHGTFIAGIVYEFVPECSINVLDVMDGWGYVAEFAAAQKIKAIVEKGMTQEGGLTRTILNLSFGGGLHTDCNWCLSEAIVLAQTHGAVVVSSAGNDASCVPVYPGNFPGVTAVGALDADGDPAGFTNRGSWVDACALGVDIVSTFFDFTGEPSFDDVKPRFEGGWAVWSGTSFAAPVVVAAIAQKMKSEPQMSAVEARDAVLAPVDTVPCLGVKVEPTGWGKLREGERPPVI